MVGGFQLHAAIGGLSLLGLVSLMPVAMCADKSVDVPQPYCSFFNNRAPRPQPTLSNCTWYRDNSCCMAKELKILFAKLKPMPGASPNCILYINLLMCYICSPEQYKFYGREYLTVCVEFCQLWYDACRTGSIEGSVIGRLYKGQGQAFCEDRNFKVDGDKSRKPSERNCFFFTGSEALIPSRASLSATAHSAIVLLFTFVLCSVFS